MGMNQQRPTSFQVPSSNKFLLRIILGTVIMTLAILTILPFTQALSGDPRDRQRLVSIDAVIPPPEPPPPEPPPPPEEEEQEDTPELDTPPPMLDISMLESMLNPTTGSVAAEGFNFDQFQASASVEEAIVFSLRDLDRRPSLLRGGNITFPTEVQRLGFRGHIVRVRVRIDERGYVSVTDISDSPHDLVTQTLRRELASWRYEIPTVDGNPVSTEYIQPIEINYD